jgi:hypothetical protein
MFWTSFQIYEFKDNKLSDSVCFLGKNKHLYFGYFFMKIIDVLDCLFE